MSTFKFPFKDQTGKEVRNADVYYDALTMASSGYYPLGPSGVHCGIHYEPAMANTLALGEGVRAIAKGEVVAYRVNRSYLSVRGRAKPPMSDNVLYSSGFVLTRHTLEYPAGNKLTYFCLSMHLRSFEEYERLGAKAPRPPYWTSKIYRVSPKANDKQEVTKGSAAPVIQGLRVRAQPVGGTTPIQGILPPGTRIIGGEIQKGWVRVQSIAEGNVAPPKTGDAAIEARAISGWAHLAALEAHSQVPETFDEVVVPKTPIKVKAGALLGHLGEYRRVVDPSSPRQMLHHEIIAGADLPAYLKKSRAAALAAKPEERTVLRVAPGAQLRNAVLAPIQTGVLRLGLVLELDGIPPDEATYVKVKPVAELQWIERRAKLPAGAQEIKLYRHTNTNPYTATDLVAENNRGTDGQAKATVYRGIRVATPNAESVWIAATTYRGLYDLKNLKKERLVLSDLSGWNSYPLAFTANGYKNGNVPHHFAISALELARPATPDPTSEPIGLALDEAGKRWWQVQVRDSTTCATGWAGDAGHTGISLHSPHEWVDFSIIESESQTAAYGSYFLALADMAAFQRGEMPLKKSQLDAPLQQGFNILDTHPDGKLTLGELQAAQRSRSTVQQLSRIILRYPSEWKANPEAWKQYDSQISPTDMPAWESEKSRMQELFWWEDVEGKIDGIPATDKSFYIHPVSISSNFLRYSATKLSERGFWFIFKQETLRGVSNVLHWPKGASGVTLGPGYDMKMRSAASIRSDMISIGLSEDVATSISAASGLTETAADEFRKNNKSLVSLTEEQEFALLRLIAPHYEKMVRDSVDSDLAQHEFDALTCFAYNPAGRWSSVTSFINDGNLTDATSKIKEGVTSAGKVFVGLVKRRDDETNLLLNGRYEYHGVKIELP